MIRNQTNKEETKMTFTPDNFYKNTGVIFAIRKAAPDRNPDYVSASGSAYWHTKSGVYRQSDHWGFVASCIWLIKERNKVAWENSKTKTCVGYASWKAFNNNPDSMRELSTHHDLDVKANRKMMLRRKVNRLIEQATAAENERIFSLDISYGKKWDMWKVALRTIKEEINSAHGLTA